MSLFNLVLLLSFIHQLIQVEAVDSPGNHTNTNHSQASRTTLLLEQLLDGYDKRLRPNFGGPPCKINVSIHVMSMVPIKEIDMEVTAVLFFRQHWTDPRLAYGSSLGIPKMKLLGNIIDQVWLPDTIFVNDLSDQKTNEDFLFELTQEGGILYSYRKKLRLYCPMNLRKFPMDEQVCEAKFESYSYTEADVIYSWLEPAALRVDRELKIIQYSLIAWDQDLKVHEYSTGNFSSLTAIFHFKRDFGFYFLQEFIPTILVVALSWVGFWIDERSVPARVSLGITTVLAITTLIFGIQASMPRVGHVKAIDVFLLVSFLFVFAALVEYAIICTFSNVFSPRKEEALKQKHSQPKMNPSAILEECNDGTLYRIFKDKEEETRGKDYHDENHNLSSSFMPFWLYGKQGVDHTKLPKQALRASSGQREPCAVDKHCRKLFPVAYTLLLSIYFVVYFYADI